MGQAQDLSRLVGLLKSLFSADALRRYVHRSFGQAVADMLPGPGMNLEKFASEAAALLEQRGLINPVLFEALIAECPGRREEILAVARGVKGPNWEQIEIERGFGPLSGAQPDQEARPPSHPAANRHASLVPTSARGWLAVSTEWFSRHGGLSTLNRLLCRALAAAGEQVACLVPAADEAERQAAAADGVSLVIEVAQDDARALNIVCPQQRCGWFGWGSLDCSARGSGRDGCRCRLLRGQFAGFNLICSSVDVNLRFGQRNALCSLAFGSSVDGCLAGRRCFQPLLLSSGWGTYHLRRF